MLRLVPKAARAIRSLTSSSRITPTVCWRRPKPRRRRLIGPKLGAITRMSLASDTSAINGYLITGERPETRRGLPFSVTMGGVVFVDCEASSLNSGSFITELGWAVVDPTMRRIHTGACLIRPLAKWLRISSAWDPVSEKLTGISKDMLEREGISPADAVTRFLSKIGDRPLFADEPPYDQFWIDQLFFAA